MFHIWGLKCLLTRTEFVRKRRSLHYSKQPTFWEKEKKKKKDIFIQFRFYEWLSSAIGDSGSQHPPSYWSGNSIKRRVVSVPKWVGAGVLGRDTPHTPRPHILFSSIRVWSSICRMLRFSSLERVSFSVRIPDKTLAMAVKGPRPGLSVRTTQFAICIHQETGLFGKCWFGDSRFRLCESLCRTHNRIWL